MLDRKTLETLLSNTDFLKELTKDIVNEIVEEREEGTTETTERLIENDINRFDITKCKTYNMSVGDYSVFVFDLQEVYKESVTELFDTETLGLALGFDNDKRIPFSNFEDTKIGKLVDEVVSPQNIYILGDITKRVQSKICINSIGVKELLLHIKSSNSRNLIIEELFDYSMFDFSDLIDLFERNFG